MIQKLTDSVRAQLPRMLEGTAFLFADESEDPLLLQAGPTGMGLAFQGKQHGTLHLWAGKGLCAVLAANMLGLDENDPSAAARGQDALGELLNIAMGHILTDVYGESEPIKIGIPYRLNKADLEADMAGQCLWFSVEGHALLSAMSVGDAP